MSVPTNGADPGDPVLEVHDLVKVFPVRRAKGIRVTKRLVQAVSDVSLLDRQARDAGPGRRERIGQVDGRALRAAAHRADAGLGEVPGQGARRPLAGGAAAAAPRDADGLPGPVRLARSPADRRERDRRAAADPQGPRQPRRAGRRAARARRARARPRQALPARVLRRSAPARRHRPGAGPRPDADRARRAGVGARREHPGRRHEPAAGPPGRARPDVPVHRPRPLRRAPHLRQRRRDVPRQADGDRAGGGALQTAAAPVHAGAAVGGPRARSRHRARAQADRAGRRRAEPDQPAQRVPVPDPLPEGPGCAAPTRSRS